MKQYIQIIVAMVIKSDILYLNIFNFYKLPKL